MNEKIAEGSTSKQERRQSTTRYLKLNRLPTLQEVLDRRTRPPLDLFCLYIFLQRESAEDALDFWLDVQQHENMCKAYFKDLKRSDRTIDEDWPEYADYARTHGSHFTPLLNFSEHPIVDFSERQPGPSGTAGSTSPPLTQGRERRDTESHGPRSPVNANGEFGRTPRARPSEAPTTGTANTDEGGRGTMSRLSIRGWSRNNRQSKAPTIFQRDRAVQKDALVESAERIYLRYLLPGAEKEIYLPPSLRMPDFPQNPTNSSSPSPLIPDLFHQQKHYIFRALEADAFPRFLRAKAFANLSPAGSFWRLVLGLLILWGGFVLGFSLIFLDRKPRAVRVWVLLPFLISTNLLLSAYYSLSPLLALFRQSETGAFRTMRVREGYVGRLIVLRAMWIEAVCLALTAALTCIFVFVPGHRL